MKHYFFKTVKVEGRPRLRPLPRQTDDNGAPIDSTYNVQADSTMRGSYPIGTVFGSNSLELRTHSSQPFYSAGAIYPVGLSLGDYIVGSHIPPKEMSETWENVKDTLLSASPETQTDLFGFSTETPEQNAPAPKDKAKAGSKSVLSLHDQLRADKKYSAPTIDGDGFYVEQRNWSLLMRNIIKKVNTMLIGPSGTGKTELVMLACSKLGIDCHVYDMGSMHDPISSLLGVHRLVAGGSTFDYAKFTEDIQKPGVILLDELSRAPENTNNILFPLLDRRRELPVDIADSSLTRRIAVHPDCIFIATANIGSEYTGTREIDRALRDRFISQVEFGYMPEEEEAKVLMKRTGINKTDASNIVAVAQTVRSLYDKGELSTTLSTRATLAAADLVSDGWSALEAMELTYLPYFEGTRTDGERSVVAKIFLTR